MTPATQYAFGGFLLGATAAMVSLFVIRWARDRAEARRERIRDLEKWLYGVEKEQSALKVRVLALEMDHTATTKKGEKA